MDGVLEYLLEAGMERIVQHDQGLGDRLIDGLDDDRYQLHSPRTGPRRSTLVFISHVDANKNREIHRRLAHAGVDVALRRGKLRISPHIHNTDEDIDRLLDVLYEIRFVS